MIFDFLVPVPCVSLELLRIVIILITAQSVVELGVVLVSLTPLASTLKVFFLIILPLISLSVELLMVLIIIETLLPMLVEAPLSLVVAASLVPVGVLHHHLVILVVLPLRISVCFRNILFLRPLRLISCILLFSLERLFLWEFIALINSLVLIGGIWSLTEPFVVHVSGTALLEVGGEVLIPSIVLATLV